MDIMEFGAIGELVGGVAVVVTLGYLAVQIRQNTKSTRYLATQSLVGGQAEANFLFATHEDLAAIIRSGVLDNALETMPPLEQFLRTKCREMHSRISQLKREHRGSLKKVRLNAGAHFARDVTKLLASIEHLDSEEMVGAVTAFMGWTVGFTAFTDRLFEGIRRVQGE